MIARDAFQEFLNNRKIATAMAGTMATAGGAGVFLDWMPSNAALTKLSLFFGLILTLVLIASHLATLKKTILENRLLKRKYEGRPGKV
jgi:hypothetical protein